MNRDLQILRDSIVKVTHLLTGKGLTVTQRGLKAYVESDRTGKPVRINIPYLPDNAEADLVLAIQGFLDHEIAHIFFTDFKAKTAFGQRVNKATYDLWNMIEDSFIEREMARKFPGSAFNIELLHEFYIEKLTKPVLEKVDGAPAKEFAVMLPVMVRAWAGQEAFKRFVDSTGYMKRPGVAALLSKISSATGRIPKVASTVDAIKVAEEIMKALEDAASEPEESDDAGGEGSKGSPKDKSSSGTTEKPTKSDSDLDEDGDEDGLGKAEKKKGDKKKSEPKSKSKSKPEPEAEAEPEEEPTPEESDDKGDDEADSSGDGDEDSQDVGDDEEDSDEEDSDEEDSDEEDSDEDGDDEAGADEGDGDTSDEADDDEESGEGNSGSDDEGDDADDEGGLSFGDENDGDEESSDEMNGGGSSSEDDGSEVTRTDYKKPEKSDGEMITGPYSTVVTEIGDMDEVDFEKGISDQLSKSAIMSAREAEYKIFTDEFDKIEEFPISPGTPEDGVSKIEEQTLHMIGKMQKDIERMMASQSRVMKVPGYRSGRLHSSGLHRLIAGDDRIFRRKLESRSKDTVVCLLIDNSGSMGGGRPESKYAVAMKCGYALAQTLDRVGVASECIGFTTYDGGRQFSLEFDKHSRDSGVVFSRYEPIYMPIFKKISEGFTSTVKKRFASAIYARTSPLLSNVDGECVEIAAKRLLARKEQRKVLIVLSDGQPAFASSDYSAPHTHLKKTVEKVTEAGIETVGIGIMSDAVKSYYPRHMVLNNVEDLPACVMGELKRVLTK